MQGAFPTPLGRLGNRSLGFIHRAITGHVGLRHVVLEQEPNFLFCSAPNRSSPRGTTMMVGFNSHPWRPETGVADADTEFDLATEAGILAGLRVSARESGRAHPADSLPSISTSSSITSRKYQSLSAPS